MPAPDPVRSAALPSALEAWDEIRARLEGRALALFLDYDGTLAPIAPRPELAAFPEETRLVVERLARSPAAVAVVSGRDLRDVKGQVGIAGVYYAGSHGFEIEGPDGRRIDNDAGGRFLPALDAAEQGLRAALAGVEGALVERKRFSVAVHYRLVSDADRPAFNRAVALAERSPDLRRLSGKKVYELQPAIGCNKGTAVLKLLEVLPDDPVAFYLGDDVTDEDAMRALDGRGMGIVVTEEDRPTAAHYRLRTPDEVRIFLQRLAG